MVKIDQERCIGCGACVGDCPSKNIELLDGKAQIVNACLQCGHCVSICPAEAVSIPEYDMADMEPCDKAAAALDPDRFLRAVKNRRSIRFFKPDKVEQEKLQKMAEAARYTATACNYQTTNIVYVQAELAYVKERVYAYIDAQYAAADEDGRKVLRSYASFSARRKADPTDDYLFRNAPVVALVTSERVLDAGLAAQNMEMMAAAQDLGVLYNGFLARIIEADTELKKWLGIEGKTICCCMLAGYPAVNYQRTAPRKAAQVIWK